LYRHRTVLNQISLTKLIKMDTFEFLKNPAVVWFLIGLLFALLELAVPGLILIFLGIGAWATALLSLVFDWSVGTQILVFAIASVIALVALRNWFKRRFFQQKSGPEETDDEELIGKTARVEQAIAPLVPGKVAFKGALWKAESDETIEAGSLVEITRKNSITLFVKPIK
jgi:membrane protein implicated in regulation of membrane protease activity